MTIKLKKHQILEIIARYENGETSNQIAETLKMSGSHIRTLLRNNEVKMRTPQDYSRCPIELRFWDKVNKNGKLILDTPCWEWTGGKARMGYGHTRENGKDLYSHKVSWEMHSGKIPDGLWVLHKCDNPPCVNPAHLFLGTRADNMADMVAKGRASKAERVKGENHPLSKLTDEIVIEARRLFAEGVKPKEIALKLGIGYKTHIYRILSGKSWKRI